MTDTDNGTSRTDERVLRGFAHISSAPSCLYCNDRYYAIVDDGYSTSVRFDCWCGAHARCQRDNPGLIAIVGETS